MRKHKKNELIKEVKLFREGIKIRFRRFQKDKRKK